MIRLAAMPLPARPGVVLLSPSTLSALHLTAGGSVVLTFEGRRVQVMVDEAGYADATEILVEPTTLSQLGARVGDAVQLDVVKGAPVPQGDFALAWLDSALSGAPLPSAPTAPSPSRPTPLSVLQSAFPSAFAAPAPASAQGVPVQVPAAPGAPVEAQVDALPAPALEDLPGTEAAAKALLDTFRLGLFSRERLERLGARPQLGVLLTGPAGAGKHSLVRAVAAELDVAVRAVPCGKLATYGPDEALKRIAAEVRVEAPTIVLLEDVDALASAEESSPIVPSLVDLLAAAFATGVVAVVATSSHAGKVSPALLSPEVLPRRISLAAPSRPDRRRILEVLTRDVPLAGDVSLEGLAERTPGFLPGDLVALVQAAALEAASRPLVDGVEDVVTAGDFKAALGRVKASSMEKQLDVGSLTLDDVGGMPEVKSLLTEAVLWPLSYPESFTRLGITPPKGVLLYGPPGCGKTFIVRALAASGAANLFVVKGPELLDKYVGESEAGVRELFEKARAAAPAIVFLDELDALAPTRGSDNSGVSDRVVAALLTELDGVEALRDVVVIGATNRPDMIDPALLRPGRLERQVLVSPPDAVARADILRASSRTMPLAADVDLDALGASLEGFSSADCAALMREAALVALRESRDADLVEPRHFERARESVFPSLDPALVAGFEAYAAAKRS